MVCFDTSRSVTAGKPMPDFTFYSYSVSLVLLVACISIMMPAGLF